MSPNDRMGVVLVLGGYGNFGKRICCGLARANVPLIVAGRRIAQAEALVQDLRQAYPSASARGEGVNAEHGLEAGLERLRPAVVVNTCGPFQDKDYAAAQACIACRVHYVDLADGREFVAGITALDMPAKAAGVCVISGASTVPGLSSAVLEHYKAEFAEIDSLEFGISPGQKSERGLATTQSILTYLGKHLKPARGRKRARYGWQDLHHVRYPELGERWMANCDIPDLDLLPERYGIRHICFSAGMEVPLVHFGLWAMSWAVRLGLPVDLTRHAPLLLRASHWFDRFGTGDGGMHVIIRGKGQNGQPHIRRWFIIARKGDGPQIPCMPAIVLAHKLASGNNHFAAGARPCVGLVSLIEYMEKLQPFAVTVYADG
jgi:NAD(P)-dependent dehydrogenase (short-subunit alcohol dehydrogenase family)